MKFLLSILLVAFTLSPNARADVKKLNTTRKPAATTSDAQAVVIDANRKYQIASEQLPQKGLRDEACNSMEQILGELDGARIIADLVQPDAQHRNPGIVSNKIANIQSSIVSLTGYCGNSLVQNGIKKNDITAAKTLADQIGQNFNELQNSFLLNN